MRTTVLLLTLLLVFSGCFKRSEEKITPAFDVERLDSQINAAAPLLFHIPIDSIQVDDEFQQVGNLNNIGGAFRRFFEMLADVTIDRDQAGQLNMGPFDYSINELEDVDFSYVKEVTIKQVRLEIDEEEKAEGGEPISFKFIKRLEIYVKFLDEEIQNNTGPSEEGGPIENQSDEIILELADEEVSSEETETENGSGSGDAVAPLPSGPSDEDFNGAYLVMSYDNALQSLQNNGKWLVPVIHGINWKERLKKNRNFSLLVKLQVGEAPKQNFTFKGFVDVQVALNLGL